MASTLEGDANHFAPERRGPERVATCAANHYVVEFEDDGDLLRIGDVVDARRFRVSKGAYEQGPFGGEEPGGRHEPR